MRKDVRLGLAVGSVLIFAVLVYVVFFTGNPADNKPVVPKAPDAIAVIPPGRVRTSTPPPERVALNNSGQRPPAESSFAAGSTTRRSEIARTTPEAPPRDLTADPSRTAPTLDWSGLLQNGYGTGAAAERTVITDHVAPAAPGSVTPPGSAVPPTADGVNTAAHTYVVKPGDTLWAIAASQFGNSAYVNHIIRANPGVDPAHLRLGAKLTIPAKADVLPAGGAGGGSGPAREASSITPPRPVDSARQYRTVSGDTLSSISKKLYGDSSHWAKLYEANKDLIGPNPNAVKSDIVLILPEPPVATSPAQSSGRTSISDVR